MPTPRPSLGAPGLYRVAEEPLRVLTGVRLDVCAFVGVAPRGPAREPVLDAPWARPPCRAGARGARSVAVVVESWQGYLEVFGGFEGPGLLPYAVSAFFANGGTRAVVVRIVHDYRRPDGSEDAPAGAAATARACLGGSGAAGARAVWLAARDEGRWGNALRARLEFEHEALAPPADGVQTERLCLPRHPGLVPGAVLRLGLPGGVRVLRRVLRLQDEWSAGRRQRWCVLDAPTAWPAQSVELVEGRLMAGDGTTEQVLAGVGLSCGHPRWLARVLAEESALLWPCDDPTLPGGDPRARWLEADLVLDAALAPLEATAFQGGADRYADLVPEDFFDPGWVPGDEYPGDGVHVLVHRDDVALLVVPDLYSPAPLAPVERIVEPGGFAGPAFAECVVPPPAAAQSPPAEDLYGLRLDPGTQLDAIAALQRRLTDLADRLRSLIVLLDVPPGLGQRRMLQWRARFDSAWAAAYHPWLAMAPAQDGRGQRVWVNPAAAAAGIVARREQQLGVAFGPANALAAGAVGVRDEVSGARHGELHRQSVNVFLAERDGVRLSAARTLALDPAWRQLSVRRLVTMVGRVLDRQMQWVVFEPNDRALRAQVSRMLEGFLRQLYRANAFTGATEAQAFFVKCDDETNPPLLADQGRLLALVGIAPAEPMEFIVLHIARGADATLTVEA